MTFTTQTLTLCGLALCSALALSGCAETDCYGDTDDEVGCDFEDSDFTINSRSSANGGHSQDAPPVALFTCPSTNNRLAKSGYYSENQAVRPDNFWLGAGTCSTLSHEAKEALAGIEEQAIDACNSREVASTCGADCTKVETSGTCFISDSGADLLLEIPPRPGSSDYICVYSFWADAEGTNTVDCILEDDGNEYERGDERSSDDANTFE
jgi:hypothetical protein